jgi:hypothetical protein
MKKYVYTIIILVSITGIFSALTYFENRKIKPVDDEQTLEKGYLTEIYKSTITNESLELNNPVIYMGNDTANQMNLFDLVRGKCLVFRFSGEACNICIDFVMNKLKSTFTDFTGNSRILLIGSNINDRVKEKYYGKQIISFYSEDLGLPFEEYTPPFLFIIDRDRITKMFFIPEKTMPELTDLYLKNIKERYFTSTPE